MSKIPTLTKIDRDEPRHPGKSTYTAAATAVYPAGRPQWQHRQEARQRKIEIPTLILSIIYVCSHIETKTKSGDPTLI